jgi:predicted ABC-class ATPase
MRVVAIGDGSRSPRRVLVADAPLDEALPAICGAVGVLEAEALVDLKVQGQGRLAKA